MFKAQKTDVFLFPFTNNQIDQSNLNGEFMKYYNRMDMETLASDDDNPENGFPSNLIIVAHGSNQAGYRDTLSASDSVHTSVTEVADIIAKFEFPKDPKHEILVWSCQSGGVGGAAQLLALHLTDRGYKGQKVWGSHVYTGVFDHDLALNGRSSINGANRRLEAGELDYWIGA